VSVVLGEVRRDGRLELVCIGRPAPVLQRVDGSVLSPEPRPGGAGQGAPEAGQGRLDWRLEIGDRLVMVTEGGLDARRGGSSFEALPAVRRCMSGRDLATGLDALMAELAAFTGERADHDAAILGLEFLGAGADLNGRQRSVTYPVRS
jgi:serine phosphatase RsbU (regulator of sigma subunit)